MLAADSGDERDPWAETRALIGHEIARFEGPDAVSPADIRRKLEAIGFDCPLHYDERCAREQGFTAVPAPVSMARVWAMPAYWAPGKPRIGGEAVVTPVAAAQIPGVGDTVIATRIRVEHSEPLYSGDRVSAVSVLKGVTPKTISIGSGAFLEVETTYRNQRDEVVTVETASLFRFDRSAS